MVKRRVLKTVYQMICLSLSSTLRKCNISLSNFVLHVYYVYLGSTGLKHQDIVHLRNLCQVKRRSPEHDIVL